jgi:hypothetical protein
MDVLNEKDIFQQIVSPLVDRVNKETIPALENALAARLNAGMEQVSNVVAGVLVGLQGIEDKTNSDVKTLMESMDGWQLEITVPPITIKLKRAK